MTNILRNQEIKINTYPGKLADFNLVEFDGHQARYGSRNIKNLYAYQISGTVVRVYRLNMKNNFTPLEDNKWPLELIKFIAAHE